MHKFAIFKTSMYTTLNAHLTKDINIIPYASWIIYRKHFLSFLCLLLEYTTNFVSVSLFLLFVEFDYTTNFVCFFLYFIHRIWLHHQFCFCFFFSFVPWTWLNHQLCISWEITSGVLTFNSGITLYWGFWCVLQPFLFLYYVAIPCLGFIWQS